MPRATTPDMFDGLFDNRATGHREVWQGGQRGRHAERKACGDEANPWRELRAPWGTYPDLPANASQAA